MIRGTIFPEKLYIMNCAFTVITFFLLWNDTRLDITIA